MSTDQTIVSLKAVVASISALSDTVNGILISLEASKLDKSSPQELLEYVTAADDCAILAAMNEMGITRLPARIFIILQRSPNNRASTDMIHKRLYYHDVNGGPEANTISAAISQARPNLRRNGWEIKFADGAYNLERLKNANDA